MDLHYGHNLASQEKSKKGRPAAIPGFGAYLRGFRTERGLTLREVAAAVGMDQAHLSKAELGQRLPTPSQIGALARFFRQDPVEFEAHGIAEKFRRRHAGSAAALHAIHLLHGEQQSGGKSAVTVTGRAPIRKPRPAAEKSAPDAAPQPRTDLSGQSIPEEIPGVIVLHID